MLEVCFTSSIADCVSFCGFIVENGLLSPHVLVGCVCFHDWGCYRLFWSCFGHDRAKNALGIVFPIQAVNCLFDCVYEVVGLRTMLEVGMGAWFA